MLFEFLYEMLIPYAQRMPDFAELPRRPFMMLRYSLPFRDRLIVAVRLPSWRWGCSFSRDTQCWQRLQVAWDSEKKTHLGFRADWFDDPLFDDTTH